MKKIASIIAVFLLMLVSCQQSGKVSGQEDLSADSVDMIADSDSFIVVYRQPVNGYQVKAVVKMADYEINYADISFTKEV